MTYLLEHLASQHESTYKTLAPLVKNFVADQLKSIDKTLDVFSTEYFDHAFAPDLVLRWPTQNQERYVFLRSAEPDRLIGEESALLADTKPLVLSLDSDTPRDVDATRQARETARELEALILGVDATVDLREQASEEAPVKLLAQGLLQGGRGVADQEFVHDAARSARLGFAGAASGDIDKTSQLVGTVTEVLRSGEAARMTRVLRAMWEGNGQDGARFPGSDSLGPLGDEDLRYLIAALDNADEDFWRRAAHGVDVEQLARVGATRSGAASENFQALVRSRMPHLRGKAVRVAALHTGLLADSVEHPAWTVDRNVLVLESARARFYIAGRTQKELPAVADEAHSLTSRALRSGGDLPDFTTFVSRRQRLGLPLSMVELDQGSGQRVIFDSRDPASGTEESWIAAVVTSSTRIRRAATRCDGTEVDADFATQTLATKTSGRASVVDMIDVAGTLLVEMPEGEHRRLQSYLATYGERSTSAGAPGLFEEHEPFANAHDDDV